MGFRGRFRGDCRLRHRDAHIVFTPEAPLPSNQQANTTTQPQPDRPTIPIPTPSEPRILHPLAMPPVLQEALDSAKTFGISTGHLYAAVTILNTLNRYGGTKVKVNINCAPATASPNANKSKPEDARLIRCIIDERVSFVATAVHCGIKLTLRMFLDVKGMALVQPGSVTLSRDGFPIIRRSMKDISVGTMFYLTGPPIWVGWCDGCRKSSGMVGRSGLDGLGGGCEKGWKIVST